MDGDNAIDAAVEIKEENHYYPFGLKHKGYNANQIGRNHQYGYNGKEEQNELDLNWSDYGARNYDASLGRWMNLDPLAEKYYQVSTYNYVANSPVVAIDPDGKQIIVTTTEDKNGNITLNITLEGKIIDISTKGKIHSSELTAINQQIENIFGQSYTRTTADKDGNLFKQKVTVNFKSKLSIAKSLKDVEDTDHVFGIVDEIPALESDEDSIKDVAGRAFIDGNVSLIEFNYLRRNNNKTINHEIGHLLGLDHDGGGLMGGSVGGPNQTLSNQQRISIFNRYIDQNNYNVERTYLNSDQDATTQGDSRQIFRNILYDWKAKYNSDKLY